MIIRCPQCDFTRSVNESKIPTNSELVTCPKCKYRFRFRTVDQNLTPELPEPPPVQPAETPADIWDAVDSLHQRWQKQMDEHVTDVSITTDQQDSYHSDNHTANESSKSNNNEAVPTEQQTLFTENKKNKLTVLPLFESLPLFTSTATKKTVDNVKNNLTTEHLSHQTNFFEADKLSSHQQNPPPPHQAQNTASQLEENFKKEVSTQPLPEAKYDYQHKKSPMDDTENNETAIATIDVAIAASSLTYSATSTHSNIKPVFPYGTDTTPPEERVERDMKILFTNTERPVKNLGKIEHFLPDEQDDEFYGAVIGEVPFESPKEYGWIKGFLATVKAVMFSAPVFFEKVSSSGTLSLPFLFFLIQGILAIVFSSIWSSIAGYILDIPELYSNTSSLPILLLILPLALGLMLVFSAGWMRLILDIFSLGKVPFALVCRIICYSVAPLTLSLIPFIGPAAGTVWFFLTLIIANHQIFKLSWATAILCTLPAVITLVAGVLFFFL